MFPNLACALFAIRDSLGVFRRVKYALALLILDMNRLKRQTLHGPLNPPTLGDFKHSIPPSIRGQGGRNHTAIKQRQYALN
ncbi:MAG: hypothetical protein ACFBSF_04825 [Leptolyngbyaceae cyanobacterium]